LNMWVNLREHKADRSTPSAAFMACRGTTLLLLTQVSLFCVMIVEELLLFIIL
jgi:hypothetical protein